MKNLLLYILDRLREPSTWRGIVALLTAAGVTLSPDQVTGIVGTGMALIGLIGAFTKDPVVPPKNELKDMVDDKISDVLFNSDPRR